MHDERSEAIDDDRLGVGATIITAVFAALMGGGVGLVTTFTHRQASAVGDLDIPWGIVVSLAIVAALIAGFRLVFAPRAIAAAAAAGVVLAVAILSLPNPSGSVLVVADPLGYTWTFAPVVIAIVIVGWPRRRRDRASAF